jgi:hypothetical protein
VVAPAVAEPATFTLLSIGIGFTGLGMMYRRARKRSSMGSSASRVPPMLAQFPVMSDHPRIVAANGA